MEVTNEEKSASRQWEPIKTKPVLPDPAICRVQSMGKPGVMKCLVDWPIYCIYAFKLNGGFLCAHKDRLTFAPSGVSGKK